MDSVLWRWVHRRPDYTFRPQAYIILARLRKAGDATAQQVAYFSTMPREEGESASGGWTPFHGAWQEQGDILRVRFSYRGTDEHAHWHEMTHCTTPDDKRYYVGMKQEWNQEAGMSEMHTIFMVEPESVSFEAPAVLPADAPPPSPPEDARGVKRRVGEQNSRLHPMRSIISVSCRHPT